MPQSKLGSQMASWTETAKADFKADLENVTSLPQEVVRPVLHKIAKTHPACNILELAALEAEQSGVENPQALNGAVSAFTYIWENMEGDSPQSVTADLESLGIISKDNTKILTDLLVSTEPFRETARVEASYIRIGSPLFVNIRGVVDLRLRFHKTANDFRIGVQPTALVGAQSVVMADLTIGHPDGKERVISFLMDEADLGYMKRFVKHMERELELSKNLLKPGEGKQLHGK